MQGLLVSVHVCGFSASATKDDVLRFVQPYKPYGVRLRCKSNSPHGAQFAFVDFYYDETANSFISEKNNSRFMGRCMQVSMAIEKKNGGSSNKINNSSSSNKTNNNSSSSKNNNNSSSSKNNNNSSKNNTQAIRKGASFVGELKKPCRTITRGTFKIIASVSNTRFVALETGWQNDMALLYEGLEDYAQFAKCGVEHMDSNVVYACKERVTGNWRRCRKVAQEAGLYAVELIDHGGLTMVSKEDVLPLSQLYRDWSIKAVDIFLNGYRAASGSTEAYHQVQDHVLEKTLQLTYLHEGKGPQMRDYAHVLNIECNGESVLEQLVQKKLLIKEEDTSRVPPTALSRTVA